MHDILEKIWSWIETGEAVKGLIEIAGGALIASYLASLMKGYTFLARSLHGGGVAGYFKSLGTLAKAIKANKLNPRILESSRLLTEIEILNPRPERPERFDFRTKPEFLAEKNAWKSKMSVWRAARSTQLRRLIAELKLKRARGIGHKSMPDITATVGQIESNRQKIQRYFEVANYMDLENSETFLSNIKIRDGFFAPTFLIAGIMTRYQDDWDHIISNYRKQLETKLLYSRELIELRSFQFNCWLLWGPSIAVCGCGQWTNSESGSDTSPWSKSAREGSKIELAHQYGFGDESNSLDLTIAEGTNPHWRQQIQTQVLVVAESDGAGHVAAAPVDIIGKVKWGPKIDEALICLAQKAILGGSAAMRRHQNGRVVIEYSDHYEAKTKISSRYYSAYIWAMFVIIDTATDAPFFGGPAVSQSRWRDLLPFFEHGNIADATTYLSLKRALTAKIVAVAGEILSKNSGLKLSFACSFDETRCEAGMLYPPPEKERISFLLKEEALKSEALRAAEGRFLLPGGRSMTQHGRYASCQLPEIVEEFYNELDNADSVSH